MDRPSIVPASPTRMGPIGRGGRPFDDWELAARHGPLRGVFPTAGEIIGDVITMYGEAARGHVADTLDVEAYLKRAGRLDIADLRADPLVGITGSYGDYYGAEHFHEITLHTLGGRRLESLGARAPGRTRVELFAPDGHVVVALFGSALRHTDGTDYLSAIGLHTMPIEAWREWVERSTLGGARSSKRAAAGGSRGPAQEADVGRRMPSKGPPRPAAENTAGEAEAAPQTPGDGASDDGPVGARGERSPGDDRAALGPLLPGYHSDAVDPGAPDLLDIERDVSALATVMASESVSPPLSIGLFGDWGTGKSFFMKKLQRRIDQLALSTPPGGLFCRKVIHVEFNAWHFADANLWASLVTHIYDCLFAETAGKDEEEELRRRLSRDHAAAIDAKREAEEARRVASEAAKAAQDRLIEAERSWQGVAHDVGKLLGDEPKTAERLDKAARAMGLPQLGRSYEELEATAQSLRTLSKRGANVSRMVTGTSLWKVAIPVLLLTLLLPPLIDLVIARFEEQLGWLNAFAAEIMTTAGTVGLWIRGQVKRASRHIDTVEEAFAGAEAARARRRAAVEEAEREEAERARELAASEARVARLSQEIEEQRDPKRRLERLIESRAKGDDYRKHLGIISEIRRDFELMSKALAKEHAAPGDTERMRIILYIDDLDRCRADRVVEVLEAVHLLLAFPLFVVVVAVDPRWLQRCLERRYVQQLAASSEGGVGAGPPRDADGYEGAYRRTVRSSTPQDYLEKIFQIPFALRRVGGRGFTRMIVDLVGTTEHSPGGAAPPQAKGGAPSLTRSPLPSSTPSSAVVTAGTSESTAAGDARPSESGSDDAIEEAAQTERALDLRPATPVAEAELLHTAKQLKLTERERRDIVELGALFAAPRSVKRFVNIYRLLRVRVPDARYADFIGGEYRVALVMLAVITAFPNQAARFLQRLHWWMPKRLEVRHDSSWHDFLRTLEKSRSSLAELDGHDPEELAESYGHPAEVLTEIEKAEWNVMCDRLRAVVLGSEDAAPNVSEDALEHWAREVARFSFSSSLEELV